jgi:membrane-bound ClpP family serine protease
LLVRSAKGTYDTQRGEILQMAAKVTFLDRVLGAYGPETATARAEFRTLMANAVHQMWPDEAGAKPVLKPMAGAGDTFYAEVQRLNPQRDAQRALKTQAASLAVDLGQLRMLLLAQTVPSIPKPLLVVVMVWLGIIFLGFSLLAPPNLTTTGALVAAAISVAGAMLLILELDQPLGGLIRLSSEPMRNALSLLPQ